MWPNFKNIPTPMKHLSLFPSVMFLLVLISILFHPTSGSCETREQAEICLVCEETIDWVADDCCHDSNAFEVCRFCYENEGVCKEAEGLLAMRKRGDQLDAEDALLDSEAASMYIYPPERRAKYFLGKRSKFSARDISHMFSTLHRRAARPFLGKRISSRPFLGKRIGSDLVLAKRDLEDAGFYDNHDDMTSETVDLDKKSTRPFLGKRDVAELEEDDLTKRSSRPFLGKRKEDETGEDKRSLRPFLGKRSEQEQEKRGTRPFLGKREYEGGKRGSRPFLGKRSHFVEEDSRGQLLGKRGLRPFLGKRGNMRPFLGKRSDVDADWLEEIENSAKRSTRPFLGRKRSENTAGLLEPVERRGKYFLGKRAHQPVKRPKFFLGKRTESADTSDMYLSAPKRPKFFLGRSNL